MLKSVIHRDFADRMAQACDGNQKVPPINYGRLGWFVTQFQTRFGTTITAETVRKWFAGESRPRHKTLIQLARILDVDEAWLAVGRDSAQPDREKVSQGRRAGGVIHLIAGLLQLCGGVPAFPEDVESPVHLQAIIRGVLYPFHIVMATEKKGDSVTFTIPANAKDTVVIGVVRTGELTFDIYELAWDKIEERFERRGAFWTVTDHPADMAKNWRKIETFSERL